MLNGKSLRPSPRPRHSISGGIPTQTMASLNRNYPEMKLKYEKDRKRVNFTVEPLEAGCASIHYPAFCHSTSQILDFLTVWVWSLDQKEKPNIVQKCQKVENKNMTNRGPNRLLSVWEFNLHTKRDVVSNNRQYQTSPLPPKDEQPRGSVILFCRSGFGWAARVPQWRAVSNQRPERSPFFSAQSAGWTCPPLVHVPPFF